MPRREERWSSVGTNSRVGGGGPPGRERTGARAGERSLGRPGDRAVGPRAAPSRAEVRAGAGLSGRRALRRRPGRGRDGGVVPPAGGGRPGRRAACPLRRGDPDRPRGGPAHVHDRAVVERSRVRRPPGQPGPGHRGPAGPAERRLRAGRGARRGRAARSRCSRGGGGPLGGRAARRSDLDAGMGHLPVAGAAGPGGARRARLRPAGPGPAPRRRGRRPCPGRHRAPLGDLQRRPRRLGAGPGRGPDGRAPAPGAARAGRVGSRRAALGPRVRHDQVRGAALPHAPLGARRGPHAGSRLGAHPVDQGGAGRRSPPGPPPLTSRRHERPARWIRPITPAMAQAPLGGRGGSELPPHGSGTVVSSRRSDPPTGDDRRQSELPPHGTRTGASTPRRDRSTGDDRPQGAYPVTSVRHAVGCPQRSPSGRHERRGGVVRQRVTAGVGAVILVAVVFALNFYRLPVVALSPGPTEDVLARIKVRGRTPVYESKGQLYLTSVGIDDNVRFYEALLDLANPDVQMLPRARLYPEGDSSEEIDRRNAVDMDDSKLNATVVALRELGYKVNPSGTQVVDVAKGAP